jgi:beta-glucosidase
LRDGSRYSPSDSAIRRFISITFGVEPETTGTGGNATVRADVTNTGTQEGDEVAELYIHQRLASVTRPVEELRGLRRVKLKPGEKTMVEFPLTPDALSLLDLNMNRVVEPGTFDLMVGPSSAQTETVPLQVVSR